jgi:putative transposase
MGKAHKIKLYPTKSQEILLRKSCGVARCSYNWALSKWKEMYDAGEKPSAYGLIKLQNSIKREQMPFFMEVSKTSPQYAIHNLERAFRRLCKGLSGYPKYKRKGVSDSFVAVDNCQKFNQNDFKIHIPRIGKIKCSENLRFDGKVNNVVVTRICDMWFAVINIEIPDSTPALKQITGDNQAIVGVDFGIKTMMFLSNGTVYENPKALKRNLRRLKIKQRRLSKKQKGSKNRLKEQMRVARHHYRISCIRSNAIQQATSQIVANFDKIVIEDLNVVGMTKNHKLAQAVSDVSFGEMRRQLVYKAAWSGKEIVIADRFFASSKTCSKCGHKKNELKLSERIYKCESCGLEIDRDLNAAKNLAAYRPTSKSEESYACGSGSPVAEMQHSPEANQELSNLIIIKI